MCGFITLSDDIKLSNDKIESLRHKIDTRGPDAFCHLHADKLHFLHARLAIQNPNPVANQPLVSDSFILTYNGEIYNHLELRERYSLYSDDHSDTRTLLLLFEKIGVAEAIAQLDGMFAVSVLDRKHDKLYFARDQHGQKPLYYHTTSKGIVISSVLSIFNILNPNQICHSAIIELCELGYNLGGKTIFANVVRATKGTLYCYDLKKRLLSQNLIESESGCSEQIALNDRITQNVGSVTLSDRGFGLFLSGGIDSSVVAISLNALGLNKHTSYTLSFESNEYNEASIANKIAASLKLKNKTTVFKSSEVASLIGIFVDKFDDPILDPSVLPLLKLSQVVSNDEVVVLTGDGADELFGGYSRYKQCSKVLSMWKLLSYFPDKLRNTIVRVITLTVTDKMLSVSGRPSELKLKIDAILSAKTKESALSAMICGNWYLESYFRGKSDANTSNLELLKEYDLAEFLPNSVLTKSDRCTMAFGLEARSPFLNKSVSQQAISQYKYERNSSKLGKKILREIIAKRIPNLKYLFETKKGFGAPIGEWTEVAEELVKTNAAAYTIYENLIKSLQVREGSIYRFNPKVARWRVSLISLWLYHNVETSS